MQIEVKGLKKEFIEKKKVGVLKKSKKVFTAVDGIDLKVRRGEIVGFIGPNGAGKSTTIKMLTGIIQPTEGNISIDGLNPCVDRKRLSYKVGCMFGQRSQLYMHLTVLDSFKLLGSIYDLSKDQVNQRVNYVSKTFKIQELLNQTVKKLSLGQRMICEIAGAFIHEPQILFLDEPTIGLDVMAKENVRNIVKTLNKDYGTTVFLTSHDMKDIEEICDRVIVINHGRIIKDIGISKLRTDYFSNKDVTIYFSSPIQKEIKKYNVSFKNDNVITTRIDSRRDNMDTVIAYFSQIGDIKDLYIEPITMEEIIKKIYEEGGKCE